jgi:hypothetical protein
MSCSPHWGRLLTQRSLARPKLRPLCAKRVATLARVDTAASLSVASLVTCLARPRGRVFVPKCPKAETAPLPGRGCHAATGARIVPWRQPGDWLINLPIAPTAFLRFEPKQDEDRHSLSQRTAQASGHFCRSAASALTGSPSPSRFLSSISSHCRSPILSSGSERRCAMEATGRTQLFAWLPPGHHPGKGGGVASTARQRDNIWPWDILERRRDLRIARGIVNSDANDSRVMDSVPSERGDSCRTEQLQLRSRKRAFRERATSAGQADGARAVGPGTALETSCHGSHGGTVPVTSSAGVTAPGYGGHVTGHSASHGDHAIGPGLRGGVGRRGSGFHQGGRAGQKASMIDKNQCEPSIKRKSPNVIAKSQVLEFEPGLLPIPTQFPSPSPGQFLAPTHSHLES